MNQRLHIISQLNRFFGLSLILLILVSCKDNKPQETISKEAKSEFTKIVEENYELYKPTQKIEAVLILFGGYPEVAEDVRREFKILDIARKRNVAVILSNYNQKLWFEENEKYLLAKGLQEIFVKHNLLTDNIFIGGFSSGGLVSLQISNFIVAMKEFYIDPKGVFIVDSPIDLAALYRSSEKNVERDFSEVSVQESTWLLETLGNAFGNPNFDISPYEKHSVFTLQTKNINNLKKLKDTKIRLYTEPDTLWWKEHRMADYSQMNAYYIKKMSEVLKEYGFRYVEYIPTENRGYRSNGERHPHSWSIVDEVDLLDWILEE